MEKVDLISPLKDFVFFIVEGKTYGVIFEHFERVFRAVEITTLPKAPSVIQGVFNLHGEIIPVINLRNRFGLIEKEIELTDKIIVINYDQRRFAIIVDDVLSMIKDQELLDSKELYDGIDYVSGIVKYAGKIVIICNTEKLFQPDDEAYVTQIFPDIVN